ncbi:hypothetical protein QBC32DRAFT_93551 [Pseudoneurospora amorphoporcata]|uniref:Uncharacterized protein n=1 Tax=Pseudoneurospora amorphoporcata TaxID=241081 RepID=A0AAN6NK03_9PEZI|nr:hypothetical protein QBC32DRAFT_93551 [Pseudoneurospora amorphoporcata]
MMTPAGLFISRSTPSTLLRLQRPAQRFLALPLLRTATTHIASTTLPTTTKRTLSTTSSKMASDDSYMAFLNKANEDPSVGYPRDRPDPATQKVGRNGFKTRDEGVSLPSPIAKLLDKGDKFYVSDADEPFEGVALKFGEESLPDEETFASLINHPSPADAEIEISDPVEWDRNGQYTDLIDAVTEASEGRDVRVYRVVKDSVRVEYWVVSVSADGKLLVGVRALAVES